MTYSHLIDQIEKLLKKKFLDQRAGTGCDKMNKFVTKLKHFSFQISFSYSIDQIYKLLQKKFLYWRSGIGCDKMP